MKKMITLLCTLLSFLLAAEVFAANRELPMIDSQAELQNFALGKVAFGYRGVSGNFDWSYDNRTFTEATGAYAEEVLKKLFDVQFSYKLVNSNDTVNGYVWLYDSHTNLIFYGNASYESNPGEKVIPRFNIWMQDIPLLSNVQSAEVLTLDESGRTVRTEQLNINQQGQLVFPWWMAGAVNGLMVVRFNDGQTLTYNLSNATVSEPVLVSEIAAAYKIDGHEVLETVPGQTNTIKIIALWKEPTVFLDVKSEPNVPVFIDVTGIYYGQTGQLEYERPYAVVITTIADGKPYTIDLDVKDVSLIGVPFGPCRMLFKWKSFDQKPTLYTGPDYGGGKG
jgi:hypothetical protein